MDIRKSAISSLEQLSTVIECLGAEQYRQPLEVLSGSSVGKHIRHILEFYICLFDGMKKGKVNYDERERNISIENDKEYALLTINQYINKIGETEDTVSPMQVNYEGVSCVISTSYFRELVYNIEHTIHHLALIKIGVATSFKEVLLPDDVGVAYSTIQYQQQQPAI